MADPETVWIVDESVVDGGKRLIYASDLTDDDVVAGEADEAAAPRKRKKKADEAAD